jgi:hypothetical protein
MSVFRRKYKDKKGKVKVAKTYRYEFSIGGKTYRGALPEARTKPQAERAETKIRDSVYEGKYGAVSPRDSYSQGLHQRYLPSLVENQQAVMAA